MPLPVLIKKLVGSCFEVIQVVLVAIGIPSQAVGGIELIYECGQTMILELDQVVLDGQSNQILSDVILIDNIFVQVLDQCTNDTCCCL